jgi:hypothetical protein
MRASITSGFRFSTLVFTALTLCESCSPVQRPDIMGSSSAFGQPAGYYPGRAEKRDGDSSQLAAWVAKNKEGIDEIQRRIGEIREGTRPPGCIREDKYTCVATLAQKLAIADEYFVSDFNIFADVKSDVNGKPVTGSRIFFYGFIPNRRSNSDIDAEFTAINDRTHFDLTLDRNGKVTEVAANLPNDPIFAKTQEEYDATGVYETISALTAKTCPALSNADVAKWIENTVKPNSKFGPREVSTDPDLSIATHRASKPIVFCGRTFEFHSIWGNSVDLAGTTNPHGVFGGMTIAVR